MMNFNGGDAYPWQNKAKVKEFLLNTLSGLKVEIMYVLGDLFDSEISGEGQFWYGDEEKRIILTGPEASTFLSDMIDVTTQNQLMTLLENTVIVNDEYVSEE
jgi:hypothetical protein